MRKMAHKTFTAITEDILGGIFVISKQHGARESHKG